MSFSEVKFFGLTVRGFKSNIGIGRNQISSLTLDLVQDTRAGDIPLPANDGTPCFFDFAGYSFYGILQRFAIKKDISGFPTYEAVLVDPREILEGTEVIIGQYIGPVGIMPNIINAYGWWENLVGYGSSGATDETGMPWNRILAALKNTINNPFGTAYGSPLNFRGIRYGIDLSEMPSVPAYYTLGAGSNISLLEAIAQVCEDCGHDFYVFLDGFNIRIKTISRILQPPLGTITSLVNSGFGTTLIRSESATEIRNETTSSFLIGGSITQLYQTTLDSAATFWGYDSFANPIFGFPDVFNIKIPNPDDSITNYPVSCEFMNLNASGIEDIIGTDIYPCSTLEMLFAKFSHDSWATFIKSQRPEIAKFVVSPFNAIKQALFPGLKPLKPQIVNDDRDNAIRWAGAQVNNTFFLNDNRIYEFVKARADEFLGKKFVVRIPFVLYKQDNETFKITFSQEITDAGWQTEGSQPLGLSPINEDVFKSQDGRFTPFVRFFIDAVQQPVDFSQVSPADSVLELENNNLFLKCSVDPRIIILPDGTPYALVTLPSAVFQEAIDAVGNVGILLAVLGIAPAQQGLAQDILKKGFVPLRLHPSAIYPDSFAIPLKSNTATYGPWFFAGAPGKTKVEQDSGLVPWNYGGEAELQLAATSRVASAITNMQVSEAGNMELAGLPSVSLGDVLAVDGPNLTNISVSYGVGGITTNYRFETFTPKWYATMSRGNSERVRKAGQAAQQMRKSLRQSLRSATNTQASFANQGGNGTAGFLQNASKILRRESPHDTLVSWSGQDENGLTRTILSSASYEEAVSLANADADTEYQNTAIMSFTGVFRPFSTSSIPISGGLVPGFVAPSGGFSNAIDVNTYNPIGASNDIEIYSWGDTYVGLNQRDRGADPTNSRGISLRGPLVVNGFGYDINTFPVPSDGSGNFVNNFPWRADLWKVGPVDLLWDESLGVWTCHGTMTAYAKADVPTGFAGRFTPEKDLVGGLSTTEITARNYHQPIISSGAPVILHYSYKAGEWMAVLPNGSGSPTNTERLLRGVTSTTLVANGSGTVSLTDSPFGVKTCYNWFSSDVLAGKHVLIGFVDRQNVWSVLSADC